MKNTLLLACNLVLALSLWGQANNYEDPDIDVLHYTFDISVNDRSDSVIATSTIRFQALKPVSRVRVDLMSVNQKGMGMTVNSVRYKEGDIKYVHKDDVVQINLPEQIGQGEEASITVSYRGIPANGLIISKNKYGDRTIFSDNWPNRARHWLACNDHPSDKASVEFAVTAPQQLQVIANGIMVESKNTQGNSRITRYVEKVPLPTKVMVIGIADFAVHHQGFAGCVPVSSWVYRQDSEKGKVEYSDAIDILPFFTERIAPYAYQKLANVQSKTIFGGMENAGAIFYFENSVTGNREHEGLIVHEVAHQWFGNMATEKHWSHLWLSEGFATYMTHLFMENKYGEEKFREGLATDRKQIIEFARKNNRPVVDTAESNYMNLLNANSYQKGSWVLHMLRSKIGDTIFWNGVRKYYARYAGKNASTEDLRSVMEEVSGQNLENFFTQWLFTPRQPKLEIRWQYDEKNRAARVRVLQQQDHLFQFPLQFAFSTGPGTPVHTIDVKTKDTSVSIPAAIKPATFIVDPNVQLLFEAKIAEGK